MTTLSTKADDISLVIEEAIVSGELAPGTVLRQEQLSEQFDVSRTPIREALRKLAALGLVSFEPNRGVRVRTITREELREAFLVRAELESLATEAAASNLTDEALAELDAAQQRFHRLTEDMRAREPGRDRRNLTAEWVRANHAFHDVIYAAAGKGMSRQSTRSRATSFLAPAFAYRDRCSRSSTSMSRRNRASVSRFPKSTNGWTCWTAILSQRSTPRSYDAASFSLNAPSLTISTRRSLRPPSASARPSSTPKTSITTSFTAPCGS